MGIVSSLLSQSNNNMKFLLVLAVTAYVKADADPGFAYSVGHLPLAYAHAPLVYTAAHAPVVYTAPAAGCQNSEGKFVPCAQGSYFGYVPVAAAAAPVAEAPAVESERKKRDADAEATAEAMLIPRLTHGCTTAVCTDTMAMATDITMLLSPTPTLPTLTPMCMATMA